MPLPLHGRVFDRYRAFEKLSETLQQQVTSVAGALATDKVFGVQSVSLFQSAFGVKGDKLVEFVKKASRDADADKVIDGLVLNGTLALHKEDAEAATQVENFLKRNNALFVPTDNKVAGRASEHSVWSVRDGAIEAGPVKRAARLFGAKDAYAVANEKLKGLYIFDEDVALELKSKIDLDGAFVEFDKTLEHGIKVSKDEEALYIGVQSKDAQEEWLNSIINAGATYREAFNVDTENVKSVYELKDRDMQGNEVPMDKYKGKVLLIVNVSSKCGLTPTNYPELAALDEKYRDQGLEILAFPCNQFARQEPGTHEEIMEFVQKYDCKFQFFEKADVNGANARPVFTYLKAQLPGSFGNFVKWNFTKFLVDRTGKPYKRYAPKDLPFSFEEDIKTLLAQPVGGETPAAVETAKTEEPAAAKTEEAAKPAEAP